MSNSFTTKDPLFDIINQVVLGEKKLTDAELKKREEIAQAMERDNPGMDMGKKMAIATAQAKKVAEEVEQIDEVGNTLKGQIGLRDYKEKAKKDMGDAGEKLWYKSVSDKDTKGKLALIRQRDKRRKGIQRADARIKKEETEQVDEGNKENKAKKNEYVSGIIKKKLSPEVLPSLKYGRQQLKKEEVNLDEQLENFWEAYTTMFNEAEDKQQNILLRAMAKDPTDLMKMKRAIKMGDKALTNPALRQEILAMLDKMMHLTTGDPSLLQRTKMGFQKAKTIKMPEEVQLEAIGAKDKQDEGEYGYEGDMAMSQLRTIIRNCQEMMKVLDKETDMPEWVQSKITLATDYLQTANDYLMSELEEEVEKAPFEGGREVKSNKSAAERVKKIAKGMQKKYTEKK